MLRPQCDSHQKLVPGVGQVHCRTFIRQKLLPLLSLLLCLSLQQSICHHQHAALQMNDNY